MSQDFGEGKWVIGRKRHRCESCFGPIQKGERHWHYQGMYEGDWQNWRMHEECYLACEEDGDDEFMPGEAPMPDRVRAFVEDGRGGVK